VSFNPYFLVDIIPYLENKKAHGYMCLKCSVSFNPYFLVDIIPYLENKKAHGYMCLK